MRKLLLGLVLFFSVPAFADSFDPDTVVFIGSSSIEFWKTLDRDFAPLKTLNLGVGGTTYAFLLQHADEWATKYPARRYVIYSGDNDLENGVPPSMVAAELGRLLQILHRRLPASEFFVLTVKPCPARMNDIAQVKDLNTRIEGLSLSYLRTVDIYPLMIDSSGKPRPELFVADGIHMTGAGYQLWTKALRPLLQ